MPFSIYFFGGGRGVPGVTLVFRFFIRIKKHVTKQTKFTYPFLLEFFNNIFLIIFSINHKNANLRRQEPYCESPHEPLFHLIPSVIFQSTPNLGIFEDLFVHQFCKRTSNNHNHKGGPFKTYQTFILVSQEAER